MNNLDRIQQAITLAIQTHEVNRQQKRKGKDIPYITHPLTVGLLLARTGADDDVICAGLLHDTIEDSKAEHKISVQDIKEQFGDTVAQMVADVTEQDKSLPWEERKRLAKEQIKDFSHDSLLVKSADIVANLKELIADYKLEGDQIFDRFNGPKDKFIKNQIETIEEILMQWPQNPLANDLKSVAEELGKW